MSQTCSFSTLLPELAAIADIRSLTALRYLEDGAERIFTSHPQVFAAAGFKSYAEAPTMAQVRDTEAPMVSNGADEIRAGFPDGQSILDLGADAIANLPVRLGDGRVVGQLNLMGRAGAFEPPVLARLQAVADAYAACFLPPDDKEKAGCA